MENPVTCLESRHVQEAEITALPPEDLRKLFAACRPPTAAEIAAATSATGATGRSAYRAATEDLTYLRPYIAVCAFAGMRPTECTRLRWQDIDFEDSIISVRAPNSKTGGQRHIEMHPTLRAWLLACRPADAAPTDLVTQDSSLNPNLSALRARAGFGGGKWQNDCLRHSYATYYLKARLGEITQLQLNMGHRSAQLLYSRYVNMAGTTRDMAEQWWQVLPDNFGG
jgi:integrase